MPYWHTLMQQLANLLDKKKKGRSNIVPIKPDVAACWSGGVRPVQYVAFSKN